MPFRLRGEALVEIEPRAQAAVARAEIRRRRLQLAARQRVERLHPGARVALGEHHVEAEQRDAVAIEQLVDQLGKQLRGSTASGRARRRLFSSMSRITRRAVHAARHGHAQARVVDDVVELGNEAQLAVRGGKPARGVSYEEQRDREAERDPQARPALALRSLRRTPS